MTALASFASTTARAATPLFSVPKANLGFLHGVDIDGFGPAGQNLPGHLRAFLARERTANWALLTAADPHGWSLSETENRLRFQELCTRVRHEGHSFIPVKATLNGRAVDAVFVPGIPEATAKRLGVYFAQRQVLVGSQGVGRLVACEAIHFAI